MPREISPSITTPAAPNSASTDTGAPAISLQRVRQELYSASDSESDLDRVWATEPSAPRSYGHHAADAADGADGNMVRDVPDVLQPGPASRTPDYSRDQENPWDETDKPTGTAAVTDPAEAEGIPKALVPGQVRLETNPFKRKPVQAPATGQNGHDASTPPTVPANAPPLPAPTDDFSQLRVSDPQANTNSEQPTRDEPSSSNNPHQTPSLTSQAPQSSSVWGLNAPSSIPSVGPSSDFPPLPPVYPEGGAPKSSLPSLPAKSQGAAEILGGQPAWGDAGSQDKGKQPDLAASQTQSETADGWNLIDHDPLPEPAPATLSRKSTWENFMDAGDEAPKETATSAANPATTAAAQEAPPALPPRPQTADDDPPPQPPRPESSSASSKSETYQIKNISWFDATAAKNPRKSPILVQNANGPCPLVALVNALTLTTPANQTDSNLVESLRSREQISLNFLLEAVFDELMTHRHTNPEVSLPDMPELYAFLKGLHTGMNVNPRFIPVSELPTVKQQHSDRGGPAPGTFESTRDMQLYATFSIPLIHGWLPPKADPAYDSMARQASSYDDVQSILFREEELEDKLSNSDTGLTEDEQQLYQDIIIIKSFLSTSATQLTPWGLEVMAKAMRPGTISILFRNDHFSTLYCHPRTRQLFTLVTDAGYYTHEEVVWESLADVSGERTEFYSGDFRLVGGPQQQQSSVGSSSSNPDAREGGWQTVQSRRSRTDHHSDANVDMPPPSKHEQEDRDLALALQLQEEEEQRHHAEQAARRRESQLSEQFIEQQGRQGTPAGRAGPQRGSSVSMGSGGPQPPARGSSVNQAAGTGARGGRPPVQQVRSLIPPITPTNRPSGGTADDAPPSYEQASRTTPYVPPAGHPSHPESSPGNTASGRRPTINGQGSAGPSGPGRGRQGPPPLPVAGNSPAQAGGSSGKEKDCVVM
ncbi:hypothetical protein GGS23DRAFT_604638 [Durotheca rogersii]|uniref:uncharacterized protein n=1 Tax=Durotheca rogersii TaxID=419775 RepID=UPI00221E5C0F|nr:uncharacterized protein GGS23DRAFT_604638 [Durotheca rogersii]KAI5864449.1 hypothetical protein GGS23DRAFT_604638 [Durotheca rogersii]